MKRTPTDREHQPAPSVPHARVWLLSILTLGMAIRFLWLGSVPPAINQDEAERAYDAWCLRATGTDHYGAAWPIFFRAFGKSDFPPGQYIYLLMPVQAIFGMSVWSTRLPAAALGSANILLLYLLVRRLYGVRAGLLAAFFLAISPWAIHLSRIAFEVSLCPALTTLGLLLLVMAADAPQPAADHRPLNRRQRLLLLGAGLTFGIDLWTYNALRVVVPLLLLGGLVLYLPRIRAFLHRPGGMIAASCFLLGFLIGLAPFLWAWITTPEQAWARANAVSIIGGKAPLLGRVPTIAEYYLVHFSPEFLFLKGDRWAVQSITGYGKLHHVMVLFLAFGVVRVLGWWRTERFGVLLLWWILISPLPAALSISPGGHSLRSAGVIPGYEILAAIGLDWMLPLASRESRRKQIVVLTVALLAILANAAYFLHVFFVRYPVSAAREYQAEWAEVIPEIQRRRSQYAAIVICPERTNQLGILYLFFAGIEPHEYFSKHSLLRGESWDAIVHVGNVYLLPGENLSRFSEQLQPGQRILVAAREEVQVPGKEIMRFHYPHGGVSTILYDVEATGRTSTSTGG